MIINKTKNNKYVNKNLAGSIQIIQIIHKLERGQGFRISTSLIIDRSPIHPVSKIIHL